MNLHLYVGLALAALTALFLKYAVRSRAAIAARKGRR